MLTASPESPKALIYRKLRVCDRYGGRSCEFLHATFESICCPQNENRCPQNENHCPQNENRCPQNENRCPQNENRRILELVVVPNGRQMCPPKPSTGTFFTK